MESEITQSYEECLDEIKGIYSDLKERETNGKFDKTDPEVLKVIQIAGSECKRLAAKLASIVKNDEDILDKAYEWSTENGIFTKYVDSLLKGYHHRMCYRTFLVHEYVYDQTLFTLESTDELNKLFEELNDQGNNEKGDAE